MNIEVVGRHALLFDDDATAGFVNSEGALVEWNSLLIDRYDVRHLLSGPPPSRRRRNHSLHNSFPTASAATLELELDIERYLDLPPPSEEQESDQVANPENIGGYNAVAFSYGNTDDSIEQKNVESGLESPAFHPPFLVPESLHQNLPPTEKMHQIIARTAMFVSKHGGQSEIVLRVKQGKNPLFGFLMPDDHLHLYFRFLVDHQELLQTENDEKPHREEKISDGGGALSLLGSLYGNGEDDDGAIENSSVSKPHASGEPFEASAPISRGSEYTESPASTCLKDESASKRIIPSKEKAATTKKSSKSVSSSGTKKVDDKLLASSVPSIPKTEPLMVEPPSDLKRLVDKIVEFIIKNGKQFEAVLMEQDSGHGRFPFLLPTNQYHPYYLKVLEKAQESKLTGKSFPSDKDRHGQEKKTSLSKEIDTQSAGCDIPYDSDRKEKFKMVLGKTKKDGPDPPSKTTSHQQQFGVAVDAAAAAAILQAATRGIKNPNFGFLSTSSLNGNHSQGRSSSDRIQKSDHNTDQTVGVPVASAIAKTIALEAASEADSSEAHLTREQKLKAERLKRAKMFVAMLKSGGPAKTEFSRGLSVEPQESGDVSRSAEEAVVNLVAREREGSSAPVDVDKIEKSEKKHSGDELERRSKRKYRARSSRHEGEEEDEDDDDDNDEDTDDEKAVDGDHLKRKHRKDEGREQKNDDDDDKCARKKHRSHRSSRGEIDRVDEEEGDDKYSRKKRRADYSSREEFDGERRDDKYSRKKRLSSCEEINVEYEKDDEKKRRHRSRQSSSHEGTDEDDEDDKYTRKKHRSSHRETNDEDENDDDKYSRKKHHSHRSSREIDDEEDDDGKERDDKRSHKKHHKSHRSSRHTKKDGHRKRHTSSKEKSSRRHRHKHEDDRSSDEEDDKVREDRSRSDDNKHHKKKKASQVELEEGEICSKLLEGKSMKGGTSMVSLGGAGRDASVDDSFNSSSHHQDLTATAAAPSNSSQVTVVPDDLRAKVRAMLRATM